MSRAAGGAILLVALGAAWLAFRKTLAGEQLVAGQVQPGTGGGSVWQPLSFVGGPLGGQSVSTPQVTNFGGTFTNGPKTVTASPAPLPSQPVQLPGLSADGFSLPSLDQAGQIVADVFAGFGFDAGGAGGAAAGGSVADPVPGITVELPAHDHDIDIMARTMWGEARGEGTAGMVAVANIIMNRTRRKGWPNSPAKVAQQKWQFSVWNEGDPNRAKILAVTEVDPLFRLAKQLAADVFYGRRPDNTGGADHYYVPGPTPWYQERPSWSDPSKQTAVVGNHRFEQHRSA